MKNALLKGDLFKITAFPLLLSVFLLTYTTQHIFVTFLHGNIFFLFFIAFLAMSRFGSLKFGRSEARPDHGLLTWLSMIILSEAMLLLMFASFAVVFFHYHPPHFDHTLTASAFLHTTVTNLIVNWGVFPWPLYIMMGIAWAYFYHLDPETGLLSRAAEKIWNEKLAIEIIGPAIDFIVRLCHQGVIMITLCFAILQVGQLSARAFGLPPIQPSSFSTLIVVFLFCWLGQSRPIRRVINTMARYKIPLGIVWMGFVLLFGVGFALLHNAVYDYNLHHHHIQIRKFYTKIFVLDNWERDWTILSFTWFLMCTPMMSTFLGKISRGRSLRSFILAVMLLPSALALAFFTHKLPLILRFATHPLFLQTLPIISALLLSGLFLRFRDTARIDMGMLMAPGKKYLCRPVKSTCHIVKGATVFLLGFMCLSWSALSGISLFFSIPLVLVIAGTYLSFVFRACQEI